MASLQRAKMPKRLPDDRDLTPFNCELAFLRLSSALSVRMSDTAAPGIEAAFLLALADIVEREQQHPTQTNLLGGVREALVKAT